MLFSQKSSLEDLVVESLLKEPSSMSQLIKSLKKARRVSARGVYRAVSALKKADIIAKAGREVRVNEEWLRRVRESLGETAPLTLGAGERVGYTFSSFEHLDTYWKTLAFALERVYKGEIFFYNPHNFWAYLPGRKYSERTYYAHFARENRYGFFTIGGETIADKEFKREYQNDHLQIDARALSSFSRNVHITLMGSYIISVRTSPSVSKKIDQLYASSNPVDTFIHDIEDVLDGARLRLTIENSPGRAQKLRRQLSRHFYFQNV